MLQQRKQIRLTKYDYSQSGYYYITICTENRSCIFGNIFNGKMVLNDVGKIVDDVFKSLPNHHRINLDIYQIMPNHMHFILIIPGRGIARNAPTKNNRPTLGHVTAGSLPCVIRSFKSETTKQIRRFINNPQFVVWQRNYYEHIIQNENELIKIRQYIKTNLLFWNQDINYQK